MKSIVILVILHSICNISDVCLWIHDLEGVKSSLEDVVASQPPPPQAAPAVLTPAAAKKAEKKL